MKILFVVPYVPSLIRVRPFNLIRALARRGHEITLAALYTSESERAQAADLAPFCAEILLERVSRSQSLLNCLAALPTRQPLQAAYSWSPALAARLADRLTHPTGAPFDAVHVEHLRGVRLALRLLRAAPAGRPRPPILWDSVDSISHLFRQTARRNRNPLLRAGIRLELARTETFEGWLPGQLDRVLVTSSIDRQAFLDLAGPSAAERVHVLPNGVDLDYFRPDPQVERQPDALVISGKMSYHANIDMVHRLVAENMPLVWAQRPETQVWVVGKDPPDSVRALAADPRVTVTGTVPDLRPYLRRAALAVSPLGYGAGIQNKVLEAMACATPVVASPQSVAALDLTPGQDVRVAGDPQAFAGQILELLAQPAERARLGAAGRAYVERCHNWDTIAAQLEAHYRPALYNPNYKIVDEISLDTEYNENVDIASGRPTGAVPGGSKDRV
jgi:sugar transferase (PEP-CTERM/EpsH1 system associated)